MKYRRTDNPPKDKPIYALMYHVSNGYEHDIICLPIQGEVSSKNHMFCPYKKGTTKLLKAEKVYWMLREYADTYEEAVEMYNEMVDRRISRLKRELDEALNDKITCKIIVSEEEKDV